MEYFRTAGKHLGPAMKIGKAPRGLGGGGGAAIFALLQLCDSLCQFAGSMRRVCL